MKKIYYRNCPACDSIIQYRSEGGWKNAKRRNSICLECKWAKQRKDYSLIKSKICSKCKIEKLITEFDRQHHRWHPQCKQCRVRGPKERASQKVRADKRRKEIKGLLDKLKSIPCMDCGIQYKPYVMDFDHRDRSTKLGTLSHMHTWSNNKIYAEIEKCDVVCANCHRERTHNREDN